MTQTLALPSFDDAIVVVPAPGSEPGNWSGAASAVLDEGVFWLTYRVRRPLREGRGVSVVVARSEDGEHFVTVAEVRRETDSRGADVVVDCVGEATWTNSQRALRRGGRLVVCGATTGPLVSLDLRRLFWHQWSILGSTMGSHREFAEIVRLAHEGRLWPVVDSVVPLAEGAAAYARMQRGEQTGKLVIEVSP